MTTKPLPKQTRFEAIRITHRDGVIRVGTNNRGEWVALGLILLIYVAAGVGILWAWLSGFADLFTLLFMLAAYLLIGGPALAWAIGWRLAFRQMLWLYPNENVAEYRWMWHRRAYRSHWTDLSEGELEIVSRHMQVRTDEQTLSTLIAAGCLGALLGPFGGLIGLFASQGQKQLKRVPVLALCYPDGAIAPIALFTKNKEARQVIKTWEQAQR